MKKIRLIEQSEHSECGLACTAMLINFFHNEKITLQQLRDQYGVPQGGYRLTNLVEILMDYGICSKAIRITANNLSKCNVPLIAFWNNNHYVIVEKVSKNKVLVCNPANGRRWISKKEFNKYFSEIALVTTTVKKYLSDIKAKKRVNYIIQLLMKNKKPLITLFILSMLSQVAAITVPIVTQKLIDNIYNISANSFYALFIFIVLLFLVYYVLQSSRGLMIAKFQRYFDLDIMSKFTGKLLNLPLQFFLNRSTGETIFRSNLNVYIRQILSQRLVVVFVDSLFVFIYLFLMTHYSPTLTITTLLMTSFIVIVSVLNANKIKKLTDLEIIEQGKVQKTITEIVHGIETIKTTFSEKDFFDKWKSDFEKQIIITEKKGIQNAILSSIPQTVLFILPITIIVLGGFYVSQGTMTIGEVVGFSTVSSAFMTPMVSISSSYNELLLLKSYLAKLEEVIDYPVGKEYLQKQIVDFRALNVTDLSFSYSKFDNPILKSINLNINKGEKVAIVGKSGSGKSTLLKIMSGIISHNYGKVEMNNINIGDLSNDSKSEIYSTISQSPSIFNTSVKDNIIMNKKFDYQNQIDVQNLQTSIIKADVTSIIEHLPLGINTIISEQGANLSGGQKQKISLARSFYRDAPLNLYDEPTSALDNISEELVMESILDSDQTVVIVAHSLRTIKNMDRIIVMDKGEIIEEGTHKELIKNGNAYYSLYQMEKESNRKSVTANGNVLQGR